MAEFDAFGFGGGTPLEDESQEPAADDSQGYGENEYGYTEADIEALWQQQLDHAQDEATVKELALPAGSYTTVPEWTAKRFVSFLNKKPRRILAFSGSITNGKVDGKTRYRISPEYARSKDGTKVAFDHNLYLQAKAAYKAAYKVDPPSIDDIQTFLCDTPVRLRLSQNGLDNMVVGIQAANSK